MERVESLVGGPLVEFLASLGGDAGQGARAALGYAQLQGVVKATMRSRRVEPSRDADDFVNDLVLGLLEARAAGRAEAPWARLSASEAKAVIRRKTRRLACEKRAGWNGYRALRTHLRRALHSGLPPPPPSEPTSLYVGDTLSGPHVVAAAAWLVFEQHVPAQLDALTRVLKLRLRGTFEGEAPEPPASLTDPGPDASFEANQLVARIHDSLGDDNTRLYSRRLAGWTLADLGTHEGLGTTTVHDRTQRAEALVADAIRASGCDPDEAALALAVLISDVAK